MSFVDRLISKVKEKKSHIAVGLDPVYDKLPESIREIARHSLEGIGPAITEFNLRLIDSVSDLVPAIKPQIAFYEQYGIEGINAFIKTVEYGKKKGLIVIADVKRNDIGSTAAAYSNAYLGKIEIDERCQSIINADAITINPYFGSDGISPFLNDVRKYNKGLFILVKTSNPSSVELQDINVMCQGGEKRLCEVVAGLVDKWGNEVIGKSGYSSVGAVVGATYPADIKILREIMPKAYLLIPGYGAQGGRARDVINAFNRDGYGALIAASRSINYAFSIDKRFSESEFDTASQEAVKKMNIEINEALKNSNLLAW